MNEYLEYRLQKRASKHRAFAFLLGLTLSPLAYVYVEEWHWAVINLCTLNYFFLGFFLVPFHALNYIDDARSELGQ